MNDWYLKVKIKDFELFVRVSYFAPLIGDECLETLIIKVKENGECTEYIKDFTRKSLEKFFLNYSRIEKEDFIKIQEQYIFKCTKKEFFEYYDVEWGFYKHLLEDCLKNTKKMNPINKDEFEKFWKIEYENSGAKNQRKRLEKLENDLYESDFFSDFEVFFQAKKNNAFSYYEFGQMTSFG